MIDAEVKTLDYVDSLPDEADAPAILAVTLGIGERRSEGRDNFEVVVCNPSWIAREVEKRGGLWPRGMLVVEAIEPQYVRAAAQLLADQFRGSANWGSSLNASIVICCGSSRTTTTGKVPHTFRRNPRTHVSANFAQRLSRSERDVGALPNRLTRVRRKRTFNVIEDRWLTTLPSTCTQCP